jgi:hypothetical protein
MLAKLVRIGENPNMVMTHCDNGARNFKWVKTCRKSKINGKKFNSPFLIMIMF